MAEVARSNFRQGASQPGFRIYPSTIRTENPKPATSFNTGPVVSAEIHATDNEDLGGTSLLRTYIANLAVVAVPYDGPDEPLGFEPEDFPVR